MEGATNLIQKTLADHEAAILHELVPHPTVAEQVKSCIPPRPAPFQNLKSAYLQTKFIEENFPYVVS